MRSQFKFSLFQVAIALSSATKTRSLHRKKTEIALSPEAKKRS
ncbi:hypothetical protein [Nostoc sp. PCC 7524]|nr:hypothetical protein [Nostoc sp. PCC 7524]